MRGRGSHTRSRIPGQRRSRTALSTSTIEMTIVSFQSLSAIQLLAMGVVVTALAAIVMSQQQPEPV